MKRNSWTLPLVLLALGTGLFLGGVAWAVATGVAIPYQDPTPAMRAYEDFHMRITDTLMGGGALVAVVALVWLSVRLVRRGLRKRNA